MQFEIRSDQAATIAQMLYRSLADGDSITRALAWARNGLREEQQWYRPVLYLRNADEVDGKLFTFEKSGGPPKKVPPDAAIQAGAWQVDPFDASASDDELDWVPKMVSLEAELRAGLEAVNPATVRRAIDRLARLFDDQPTHVNDLLVHAAEALRLDKLREAMGAAQDIVRQTLDATEG